MASSASRSHLTSPCSTTTSRSRHTCRDGHERHDQEQQDRHGRRLDSEVNRLMNASWPARGSQPKVEFSVSFINSWFDPPRPRKPMIDKGADVMRRRFGVSDAAKGKGKLAIGNVINTQQIPRYGDRLRIVELRAHRRSRDQAGKEGKFVAEDYGSYSMMKPGLRTGATWHVREEGARRGRRGWERRKDILAGKFVVKGTTTSRESTAAHWNRKTPRPWGVFFCSFYIARARSDTDAVERHQALRRPGGQRRHLARLYAGECWRSWRERRRQVHAGVDTVRALPGRRRHTKCSGRFAQATPGLRSPPASAWSTSISRSPTT